MMPGVVGESRGHGRSSGWLGGAEAGGVVAGEDAGAAVGGHSLVVPNSGGVRSLMEETSEAGGDVRGSGPRLEQKPSGGTEGILLYMLATMIAKQVNGRKFMPLHYFRLSQYLKTHESARK